MQYCTARLPMFDIHRRKRTTKQEAKRSAVLKSVKSTKLEACEFTCLSITMQCLGHHVLWI